MRNRIRASIPEQNHTAMRILCSSSLKRSRYVRQVSVVCDLRRPIHLRDALEIRRTRHSDTDCVVLELRCSTGKPVWVQCVRLAAGGTFIRTMFIVITCTVC